MNIMSFNKILPFEKFQDQYEFNRINSTDKFQIPCIRITGLVPLRTLNIKNKRTWNFEPSDLDIDCTNRQ